MSREAYTPGNLANQSGSVTSATGNTSAQQPYTGAFTLGGASGQLEDPSKPVQYLCGDCDNRVVLKKGDPIRCKECGYRVLYKERTNKLMQFEAR